MPLALDPAAILAGCIVLGILGISAMLWILELQQSDRTFMREENVPAWPIGWINCGIFICAIVVCLGFVQVFAAGLIELTTDTSQSDVEIIIDNASKSNEIDQVTETEQGEITPWMAVWAVLLLQIPMLVTFYSLRRFWPSSFSGPLNKYTLTIWQALKQAIPLFIRFLPIIWIVSFAWSKLLTILQELDIIETFPPQPLIQIFTGGGDPLAICILAGLAVVLAPIAEEVIFRGGIYRFFKSQTTVLPAQIISGGLFAAMHWNLMSLLPLLMMGIILARVYERSGNILVPMCFHACFNGFSLLMLFIMSHSSMPLE